MYRPCLHRSPAPLELVLVRFRCDHLLPAVHLEALLVAQVGQQVEVVLVVVQHWEDLGQCLHLPCGSSVPSRLWTVLLGQVSLLRPLG